jgi:hypothetical protein
MSTVTSSITLASSPTTELPSDTRASVRNTIIKAIALTTFKEMLFTAAITATACAFTTPAGMLVLAISAIALTALNLSLRIAAGKMTYDLKKDPAQPTNKWDWVFINYVEWAAPLNVSLISLATKDVVIHEMGHAAAATLVYEKARPKISVEPFLGGHTSYFAGKLTKFGQQIGKTCSKAFVAAAGPALGIVSSTIDIGIAHQVAKKKPRLARYLNIMASVNIVNHLSYAASALLEGSKKMAGHDFICLWKLGVHPAISMGVMTALPLTVKTTLFTIDYLKNRWQPDLS